MRYHSPDESWRIIFKITEFEEYAEKFVIPGRFHAAVPPDVVEGYAAAEHIMAHAWYHYPSMDDALVKLLRLLEMAVKMRCGQLGIEVGRKNLQNLIDLVFPKTTATEFNSTLQWLRGVRNYLMHPDSKSLLGSFALNHIRQCVIMMNALFLPEQYLKDAKMELERIGELCQKFENGLFVLEHSGFRYIVHRSEFVETYFSKGKWLVLCAFHAVPADLSKMLEDGHFSNPLIYLVKDLQIWEGQINGIDEARGEPFVLSVNNHPENVATLARFEQDKSEMKWIDKEMFRTVSCSDIESQKTMARYEYWA